MADNQTAVALVDYTSDSDALSALVTDALAEAKAQGASTAEAGIHVESGLEVTVRMGEVETVEHTSDKSLGVTVYFGQRKGSATTSDFSAAAIKDTVRAACSIARYTAEDEYAGLADADMMARDIPDLDLNHHWNISADAAIELATECETAARDCDKRIVNSEGATVSSHQALRVYANSHGFIGGYPSTYHSASCAVIGQEGEGMQRDYWYDAVRDSIDLNNVKAIGKMAAERTLRRLNGRRLPTGNAPVIFAADIASTLAGHLIAAIRGGSLYRKASFLLDYLDKQIFPEHINIHEEPHLKKAMGSAPFDSEGVANGHHVLVENGILQSYVLDSYSARKLGMKTTGNAGGVHNLIIDHGDDSFDDLVKQMNKGLIVTELMGQGVNIVTGDYSRGASGFWVENGEIQYPVEEITIAGNLRDLFMHIDAVGNDVDLRGNTRTGSILIEDIMIGGE